MFKINNQQHCEGKKMGKHHKNDDLQKCKKSRNNGF
jgi:hypothetical protein